MMENLLSVLPDFVQDAVIDSLNLVPFLFVVFVFIELFENYFAKKIIWLLKYSEKIGPVIGAHSGKGTLLINFYGKQRG